MSNAIRLVIHGRVQGVGYRAWAVEQANRLGLNGWVRNCKDGTVEALFSGDAVAVAEMVEACKQGPLSARVEAMERYGWNEPVASGFTAQPTQ